MIDRRCERLVALKDVRKVLLIDDPPTYETIRQWIVNGVRDGQVRLDAVRIGRRIYTSREAVDRFLEQSSVQPAIDDDGNPNIDHAASDAARDRIRAKHGI